MPDRVGDVPGPNSTDLIKRRDAAVPRAVFNTAPIFVASGQGAELVDVDENVFLDFAGGLGVLNVGRGNPKVVEAVVQQAQDFIHECFHVSMYPGYVELAEKLNELTPGDHEKKTMLANSGAEAVENAVKVARYATGRSGVLGFSHAFHGRTTLAMTLTAKQMPYKSGFAPFAPEVYRAPFAYCYRCPINLEYPSCGVACAETVADTIDSEVGGDRIACMIVEPVMGEGGFIVPPKEYLPALKQICTDRDILYIDDEVQAGMGRTGKMFAIEHYGVVPDIVTTAKSLGAGMPISGITGPTEVMDSVHVGGLGGTYGGNPVACAAALAVISELSETDLLARGERQAATLRTRLDPVADELDIIGEIRGLGPMIGLELVTDPVTKEPAKAQTSQIIKECYEKGLLVLKAGTYDNVVRLLAPLVITDDQMHEGLDILVEALRKADASLG
jgi:4-aminobutyrate aminotransferase/(S)-3-amino-2-methylpropionate transaminase